MMQIWVRLFHIVIFLSVICFLSGCSVTMTPLRMEQECYGDDCGVTGLSPGDNVKIELKGGGAIGGTVDDCSCKAITLEHIGNFGLVRDEVIIEEIVKIFKIEEGSLWTILGGLAAVIVAMIIYGLKNFPD